MGERVLVIGGGGREHALGWSIAQNPGVDWVFYAPGNAGTSVDNKCRNLRAGGIKEDNFQELADIVEEKNIDMIVVGPEQPLVDGIVNFFNGKGFFNIFGPTAIAAKLESDKFLSYRLMHMAGIPQAESMLCYKTEDAEDAIKNMATDRGIVIKARGLTAGKGVYVCGSKEEALAKLKVHAKEYGQEAMIAERLFGEEFSVFGISDGERVVPLEISVQDHKRLLDNDKGPNTGGMGAYCPAPVADADLVRKIADEMMTPVIKEIKKEGNEFKGFLYAAVIMTKDGPKILEYNVRFGDPEAQPVVMMLKDGMYKPIKYALEGKLDKINIEFKEGAACCVVMASNGYPAKYDKGIRISGLEEAAGMFGVKVFHAGTGRNVEGQIVTSGGRVLGVTAYSPGGIAIAQKRAYETMRIIDRATTELNERRVFISRKDIAVKAFLR